MKMPGIAWLCALALGLGSLRFSGSLPEWLLLILALAAIAAMVVLLGYMRRKAGG